MNCSQCGSYNPSGQLTCLGCSSPLAPLDAFCAAHSEVKASGTCSRCGTFGCGACLASRGSRWLCPQCFGRGDKLPWDHREELGLWRAWWRTSVLVISSPSQALSTAEPDASLGSSMLFAFLASLAGLGPTMLLYVLILTPVMLLGDRAEPGPGPFILPAIVLWLVMILGFQMGAVLFTAAVDHLALMLLGEKPKNYTVSVRAYALSMGPYVLGLLPFCSVYVYPVWSLVLRILSTMHLHKTTAGKATAAVLVPMVLLCGGGMALFAVMFALAAGHRG